MVWGHSVFVCVCVAERESEEDEVCDTFWFCVSVCVRGWGEGEVGARGSIQKVLKRTIRCYKSNSQLSHHQSILWNNIKNKEPLTAASYIYNVYQELSKWPRCNPPFWGVKLAGTVVPNIIGSGMKIALKLYISVRLCFGSQVSTDAENLWVSVCMHACVCVCVCVYVRVCVCVCVRAAS